MAFDLTDALIRTQALRVAPPGQLFWYTSGTVGPYYINTHFLYGDARAATELLGFIQADKEARESFPQRLLARVQRQYADNAVYRAVIDLLVACLRENADPLPDYVSGGERRDWFFSAIIAVQLRRPHLLLYKDNSRVLADGTTVIQEPDLDGLRTMHAADLVTEASSYTRNWIPAIRAAGGEMAISVNVVDRAQGGLAAIEAAGVPAHALIGVDLELFDRLRSRGRIDPGQHAVLCAYLSDPRGAMTTFLESHPEFLRQSLASRDEKTAARARLLLENGLYDLSPRLLRSVGWGH